MPALKTERLEELLDHMPTPMVLVEPGTGNLTFANRAAHLLAGGELPHGPPERRASGPGFAVTDPEGRPLPHHRLPSVRAARGERIENVEVVWHTPAGAQQLMVQASTLPATDDRSESIVLSFENVSQLKTAERERAESAGLLDALFESAPIGLGYFDRELRYARVNDKLARINGVPVEDHVGRTVAEVLPGMDPGVEEQLRRVLDTGIPAVDVEFVGETPAAAGEERHFSSVIYPIRGAGGQVTGLGTVVLDITARRHAEIERARALKLEREAREAAEEGAARARFLAEASRILDESLDYEATLAAIARLAVPWLADWFAIDMADADGTLRRVITTHVDPAKVELAKEWERRYPTDPDSPTGPPNVMRTGRSEIYPEIDDDMLVAGARDEEHLELIRSLGMRAAMAVPMIVRGHTLGVITFIAAETGRTYGDDDLLLAEELARRAATSIENARLYSERHFVAQTLQNSLLPPRLPEIPGLDVAARYLPVGEGNDVGGDFYDLFEMAPDCWAIVIGDVCGKGAEAAGLTALVRYTIRAIATADKLPSEVLRQVNDAILRQRSDNRFCTVLYSRLVTGGAGAHVELASGGHPLPIVRRADGSTELIGEAGTLLGVVPDPRLSDAAADLGTGDALALYTDGVTEAGAPRSMPSHEELAGSLRGSVGAAELTRSLERTAVEASGGNPRDDIAIVALHVRGR